MDRGRTIAPLPNDALTCFDAGIVVPHSVDARNDDDADADVDVDADAGAGAGNDTNNAFALVGIDVVVVGIVVAVAASIVGRNVSIAAVGCFDSRANCNDWDTSASVFSSKTGESPGQMGSTTRGKA